MPNEHSSPDCHSVLQVTNTSIVEVRHETPIISRRHLLRWVSGSSSQLSSVFRCRLVVVLQCHWCIIHTHSVISEFQISHLLRSTSHVIP